MDHRLSTHDKLLIITIGLGLLTCANMVFSMVPQ
jgi:hypothetical protein